MLPRSLRVDLAEPVDELAGVAQSRYRNHNKNDESAAPHGAAQRRVRIENAARSVDELKALRKIVRKLQKTDPKLTSLIGW